MKKQPVDDFFARKLRDAEVPVSTELFSQLQQRMGTKPMPTRRRVTVAWWYTVAAACMLFAVGILYLTGKTEYTTRDSLAEEQTVLQTKLSKQITAVPNEAQQNDNVGPIPEVERKSVALKKVTYPVIRPIQSVNRQTIVENRLLAMQKPVGQAVESQSKEISFVPTRQITATIPTSADRIDQVSNVPRQSTERTIVLTIDDPQTEANLAVSTKEIGVVDQKLQVQASGLSGFFGKIKQLKNGEVLAKSQSAVGTGSPKNRFGRVFARVKETLKNETTLE